jgi:hypothetical protein
MQLSQMWREHLQAGCPPEMRNLNIAGTSACVSHTLKMDSRIERRLHDIAHALETITPATPEAAAYCSRLNKLVSAVLVNAGPAVDADKAGAELLSETARMVVRPGMRRR